MKPRNMPERVNARRVGALARLTATMQEIQTRAHVLERASLADSIRPNLRDVRSKKRGGRPSLSVVRPASGGAA